MSRLSDNPRIILGTAMRRCATIVALWLATFPLNVSASPTAADSRRLPDAASRTYAQNYKDSALAFCIAKAYAKEPGAADDASSTADGIDHWGSFDQENATGKVPSLVEKYLAREYRSWQGPPAQLNLLKCLDMYHGPELETQVRRFVPHPKRTWRQDHPAKQ